MTVEGEGESDGNGDETGQGLEAYTQVQTVGQKLTVVTGGEGESDGDGDVTGQEVQGDTQGQPQGQNTTAVNECDSESEEEAEWEDTGNSRTARPGGAAGQEVQGGTQGQPQGQNTTAVNECDSESEEEAEWEDTSNYRTARPGGDAGRAFSRPQRPFDDDYHSESDQTGDDDDSTENGHSHDGHAVTQTQTQTLVTGLVVQPLVVTRERGIGKYGRGNYFTFNCRKDQNEKFLEEYMSFLSQDNGEEAFFLKMVTRFFKDNENKGKTNKDSLLDALRKEFFFFRLKLKETAAKKNFGKGSAEHKAAVVSAKEAKNSKSPSKIAGESSLWQSSATDAKIVVSVIWEFKDKDDYTEKDLIAYIHTVYTEAKSTKSNKRKNWPSAGRATSSSNHKKKILRVKNQLLSCLRDGVAHKMWEVANLDTLTSGNFYQVATTLTITSLVDGSDSDTENETEN
jgi:hypothetical protein